jgi:hypothetical protein
MAEMFFRQFGRNETVDRPGERNVPGTAFESAEFGQDWSWVAGALMPGSVGDVRSA